MGVTLTCAFNVSRVSGNNLKSTIMNGSFGFDAEKQSTIEDYVDRGQELEVTTDVHLYAYVEHYLDIKFEILAEDNSVDATFTREKVRGLISLPSKCRVTFKNPQDNTLTEPIYVRTVVA